MNVAQNTPETLNSGALDGVIKLAVMAVGGQGGGVLTGWIESLARHEGYSCQATSVAGVAQRTGATIYYVEMAPAGDGVPVFSLAPANGDVDILIAAEMMEAGRAIMRGFVTPDRTTLIASSHRALAVSEKMVPGDGIADAGEVLAAAEIAADRLVCFDMEQLAVKNGSVISATLFGALAGSGALPFDRAAFEEAIKRGGKGVDASLRAFGAAYEKTRNGTTDDSDNILPDPETKLYAQVNGSTKQKAAYDSVFQKITNLPSEVRELAEPGLRKVVEFMDVEYGHEYFSRLQPFVQMDNAEQGWELAREAAKYISNAMAYDDVIRVADLKTRAARGDRIRTEMKADSGKLLQVTEFLHPRAEEIVGMLPARLGARWEASPKMMARIDRWFNRGRRLRSDSLRHFIMLYILGGLKTYRRRSHRHALEQAHLKKWLNLCKKTATEDYSLAVEILKCRRLIKGYSDTHARGLSKFDRAISSIELLKGRNDASQWLSRIRDAALKDEKGEALDGAIKTVESFARN